MAGEIGNPATVDTIPAGNTVEPKAEVQAPAVGNLEFINTQLWWAEKFAQDCIGRDWRYCADSKSWYHWNGRYWKADEKNKVRDLCWEFLTGEMRKLDINDDDDKRQIDFMKRLSNVRTIKDVVEISQSYRHIAILEKELDVYPYVLNMENGEYDLKTGILHAHDPLHMHTKCCNVKFDPKATCPEWEKHIQTVLDGDVELIKNVQEILGYALFEGNPEAIFVIFHGSGRNGKSVTLETIQGIMGTYSASINPDCLMETGSAPGSDRMKMIGSRLIVASEPGDTGRGRCSLDTSFIKAVTGGDTISSRRLYCESINFKIGGLVIISTNTMPLIRDQSVAMRERTWAIPFGHYFSPDDRVKCIVGNLLSEGSGIFNWLLEGYRRYTASGRLRQCRTVQVQTEEYLDDEDSYHEFFNASGLVRRAGLTINGSEFYKLYEDYCNKYMLPKKSGSAFGRHMKTRFQSKRVTDGIIYSGIGKAGQNVIAGM